MMPSAYDVRYLPATIGHPKGTKPNEHQSPHPWAKTAEGMGQGDGGIPDYVPESLLDRCVQTKQPNEGFFESMTKQTASSSRSDPPASLSKTARVWWRKIIADFEIRDGPGLILLESTLQAWDRLQEARAAILRDGVILTAANGRVQAHPAVRLERDARSALVAGFRALRLDLEPLEPSPGRPPDR